MFKRANWIFFVLTSVLLTFVRPSIAQDAKFRVDGQRTKGYVEWLSQDELEGRQSLTAGYRKAADWAAANFERWGLEPAGEDGTYFQKVPIKREFTHMTGMPDLRVGRRQFFMEEGDFAVHPASTAGTSVRAEVVFVGYGISAPDEGLDEYAGVDVRGKIVLILKGSPSDTKADGEGVERMEPPDPWKEHCSDEAKIRTAYDRRARAVLLYEVKPPAPATPERGQKDSEQGAGFELKFDRKFLIFTISGRVLRAIMKADPQESLAGLNRRLEKIQEDVSSKKVRSMPIGIRLRMRGYDTIEKFKAENENNTERNVIAKIKGTDPKLKNEYIIMGAHMDHKGMRDGFVYNGADDNASGTAVVLEVARVLSEGGFEPKRTIIFCCWCGEELGLIGSRHYVSNPCDGVSMDRVVASFNMDMVGLGDTLDAGGALNFPSIWDVIKRDQDEDIMSVIEPHTGGPGGSDHSAFITKGIETVYLMSRGGVGHGDYHRPEDDAAKIDPEILRKTGQFVLQGTMNLANETQVNLFVENRQVLYEAMRLYVANINPDIEGSAWTYVDIDGYSKDKLRWRVAAVEKKPNKTLDLGIKDLQVFQGDVELLVAASDALGFGRVDIKGSDGVWVVEGRLTRKGRYAFAIMQENEIAVNLVNPSPQLLRAALETAIRPFIVTGYYSLNASLYDKVNQKEVLLGVKFAPDDVEGCVRRLEELKAGLGDADNLILYLDSTEGLDEAKKALYIALTEKGWKAEQIGGDRARSPGVAAGNIRVLR